MKPLAETIRNKAPHPYTVLRPYIFITESDILISTYLYPNSSTSIIVDVDVFYCEYVL